MALTLPDDVVKGLRRIQPDIARAIVDLFEQTTSAAGPERPRPDAELVTIADRRYLIVVNKDAFLHLPGVNIIPLHGDRAFLALEPGRNAADVELAIIDRLDDPGTTDRERDALKMLRTQLKSWRNDHDLVFHNRSIIVVERTDARSRRRQ